ncbi:serine protease [Actinoplanes sp. NPDC051861]|uniref:trypsin-like serine peptidase n=1 Tax=Actinoplanes sp. NPDC051861 TaxID=3155170 RepID=UPI003419985D
MRNGLWHARVEVPGSGRRGSGTLVSDRHVLTCAHVVHHDPFAMVFLGDTPTPRQARLLTSGPWWTSTADAADVAVLELAEPVTVEPARFGPYSSVDLYAGQELTAYGFPPGFEQIGVSATFTASPVRMLGRNVQVDAKDNVGVWLQQGFAGAAAVHVSTGRVIGMIKAAARDHRIGMMVPVPELARHVPGLDRLISLGPFDPYAYTALRSALRASSPAPEFAGRYLAGLRAQVPGLPRHLNTVQAVAEALVMELMFSDDEMAYRLGAFLVQLGTREAGQWVADFLLHGADPGIPKPGGDGRIEVAMDRYHVTFINARGVQIGNHNGQSNAFQPGPGQE